MYLHRCFLAIRLRSLARDARLVRGYATQQVVQARFDAQLSKSMSTLLVHVREAGAGTTLLVHVREAGAGTAVAH